VDSTPTAAHPDGTAPNEVVIRVKDSGVGIAPEHLPRIFDAFYQADRSLERSQGGLGIGLTLVRRLVEMHGGTVEAHSAGINQGSEFAIRLPVQIETGQSAQPHAREGPVEQPPSPRLVLVVD